MAALCCLTCPACNRADYATHEGRWETTNRHFYVDLPAEKRMVKPEYYNTAADRTHHIHAALAHEAAKDSRAAGLQEGPCGRAGARGEPVSGVKSAVWECCKLNTVQMLLHPGTVLDEIQTQFIVIDLRPWHA